MSSSEPISLLRFLDIVSRMPGTRPSAVRPSTRDYAYAPDCICASSCESISWPSGRCTYSAGHFPSRAGFGVSSQLPTHCSALNSVGSPDSATMISTWPTRRRRPAIFERLRSVVVIRIDEQYAVAEKWRQADDQLWSENKLAGEEDLPRAEGLGYATVRNFPGSNCCSKPRTSSSRSALRQSVHASSSSTLQVDSVNQARQALARERLAPARRGYWAYRKRLRRLYGHCAHSADTC